GNSDADRTTGYSAIVHIDANSTGLDKDNPTIDAGYILCTLTATKNKSDISCNNYNDGQISLTVSGGRGAVSYLWNDGATTKDRQS
ncbi:SprB repeat-containing protein, partial [Acinetobacter baumannii]